MGPEIAVLLKSCGAVYVEIPKVACSSIKVALARMLNMSLEDGNPHEMVFPSAACDLTDDGPLYPGLFSFAFVRNPWDRLVSCYRDKILLEVEGFTSSTIRPGIANCLAGFDEFWPGMSFTEFIDAVASVPDEFADAHFRSQHTFIVNRSSNVAIDFLGRYESLNNDLARVQKLANLPELKLPRLQAASTRVRYREFYTRRSRERVAERFQTDIGLLGYEF